MNKIKKIKISSREKSLSKAEKREAERIRKMPDKSPLLLILYLIGLLGIMLAANEALNINQGLFVLVVLAVEAVNVFLWYIYIHKTKYFIRLIMISCAIALLFILVNFRSIERSFRYMYAGGGFSGPLAVLFAGMMIFLIFTLEFVTRNHSIMFLVCAAVIIFGPLVGMTTTPLTAIMIISFQFGFVVLNMTSASPKRSLTIKKRPKIVAASTFVAVLLLVIIFLPSFAAEKIFENDIFLQVYHVDGYIQDMVNYFSGGQESGIIDGTVSRGNLHQTGEKMFEAKTVNFSGERLYLAGFTGRYYDGNSWSSAFNYFIDKEDLAYDRQLFKSSRYDAVKDFYESQFDEYGDKLEYDDDRIYYYREGAFVNDIIRETADWYISKLEENLGKKLDMSIDSVCLLDDNSLLCVEDYRNNKKATIFSNGSILLETVMPNGDVDSVQTEIDIDELPNFPSAIISGGGSDPVGAVYSKDIVYETAFSESGNAIFIIPENNMTQNVLAPYYSEYSRGDISPYTQHISNPYENEYMYIESIADLYANNNWEGNETYEHFIELYQEAIKERYTSVRYSDMPRLTELCQGTSLTELNDITTFILYTLQTHADYSTTPGSVPYNKDTIEYFLFDNHSGYCVHYATAAIMMYRMYGIPARYVSGYAVDTNLFNNISGEGAYPYHYSADVTDKSAHAWVEIFLKDYGWVPVEVTPTSEGTMYAKYPGYDTAEMNRIMQKYGWHFKGTDGDSDGDGFSNDDDSAGYIILVQRIFLSAVVLALIVILLRRHYIISRENEMNCRQIFHRLIRALHFSGILVGMNGSEKNFAQEFAAVLPDIGEENAVKLVDILQAENYSDIPANKADTDFVREIYQKSAVKMYEETKWYKKPIFKFIMVFL